MTTLNLDNIDLGAFGPTDENEKTVDQVVDQQRQQQLGVTLGEAIKVNPDQQAKINKLSKESGVPPAAVESDPTSIETDLKLKKIDLKSMTRLNPTTSKFLDDYDRAAVAHDDIDNMKALEDVIGKSKLPVVNKDDKGFFRIGETFKNIRETIGLGFDQQGAGLMLLGVDKTPERIHELIPPSALPLHIQDMAPMLSMELADDMGVSSDEDLVKAKQEGIDFWVNDIKRIGDMRKDLTPEDLNTLEQGVRSGVESLANMTPGFVATILSGGRAAPMLFAAGSQTYTNSYAEARSKGRTADEATKYASVDAAIEVATEVVPAKILGKILTGKTGLGKGALKFIIADMGGEQLATLGQTANAYVNGLDEQLANAKTVEEMIDIQLQRQAVTAIATIVAGGAQAGASSGIAASINAVSTKQAKAAETQAQQQAAEIESQQLTLTQINETSANSKLRQRDPESFKQFVEQSDGENNTHVFVDGVQAKLYLANKNIESDPALKLLSNKVNEAASLGGEVAIPLADFATTMAGTPHFDALKEFMSMSDKTASPYRHEQAKEETREYVSKLMDDAKENVSQYVESQEIFESVRQQLVDTGMVNAQNAGVMAQVVPAWATVYAQKNGISVQEAYQKSGLIIEGQQTGRAAALQAEEVAPPVIPEEQIQERIVTRGPVTDRRQSDTSNDVSEQRQGDRRSDDVRRDRIGNMTPEEQYKAIYTNELTGLNNRRAFEEDLPNSPVVVSIDVDSLKTVNDNLGHDSGDQLLKVAGKAIYEATGGKAYHISGDEFYVLGDSQAEIESNLEAARQALSNSVVASERGALTGVDFTYGAADNKADADHAMEQAKGDRETRGERVPRGELPRGMVLNETPENRDTRLEEAAVANSFEKIESAEEFFNAINEAKTAHKKGASVHLYTLDEYKEMDLFLADEGRVGFAVKSDGDLVSVFKHPDSQYKSAIQQIVPVSIQAGVRKLDAFEGYLTQEYSKAGFVEVGREKWNEEYRPEGWTEDMGTPDVVFMEYRGTAEDAVKLYQAETNPDVLSGAPTSANIPGRGVVELGIHQPAVDVAKSYMEKAGLPYRPLTEYARVDVARAEKIADAFDKMKHDPKNPAVKAAYDAMIKETLTQYEEILKTGLNVEFIDFAKQGDPYSNSPYEAVLDVVENNHLYVFSTRDGFGSNEDFNPVDNPLLQETEYEISGQTALANDIFRAVHDYFGHVKNGVGFRANGEENAWQSHAAMYTPLARRAMTVETRGQNSWLNFGPHGEKNRTAKIEDTVFADQKIGLLPEWVSEDGRLSSETFAQSVDQTQTEAFKKWFGDSKVVDDNGDPQILNQKERGYYEPSRSLIRLTESADLSTFLHEFAHFMYDMELKSTDSLDGKNTVASIHKWFKRNSKDVAKEANSYLGRSGALEQPAFHGTAHQFDKFSLEAINSGEGNQTYGWGLYFASKKSIADFYKDKFQGRTVEVEVPENNELLDYDAPLSSQPEMMEKLNIKEKSVYLDTELTPSMSGQEVYDRLARGRTNRGVNTKQEASEYLSSLGISGLKYRDASSEGDNFVIWDEARVSITDINEQEHQAERLNQESDPDFREPPKEIIEEDILVYLDAGTTNFADKDAAIRRATHEQFARGFETYLMEGKAPSAELRNIFRTFARWLTQIYKSVRGNLRVNLDGEMREVFNRLLATEEQIAAAEARAQYAPMFSNAAMAGMTEEEFSKYTEQQEKTKDKETETLRDKLIGEITRQTKSQWKEEKQDLIDEQLDVLSAEPVYRATEGLRNGEFKLDHATVKEMVGFERTDKRGITSTRVPDQLRGMTVKGAKGVHPDEAAAFFGFNSGSEMLSEIIDTAPIGDKAAAQAEEIMLERHGDIMHDGTIEQQADEALQNEERGKLILQELKALRKGTNAPALDRATIKAMAEENIAKLNYRSIFPQKYRKAELRAAQEAAAALAKGDKEAAATAKARQVLNYYLGMAATDARNDTLKIVDRMSRYNKKKVREEIQKAENGYWEQLVKILNRFEFRKSATLKQVDEVNEDINSWMKARMDEDGDALVLSPAVLNETFVTHWKNVPYSDLQGINDSVKNIEHVARYSNKLTRMGEEIEFRKLVDRWVNHMEEAQPSRFQPQRTSVVEGRNWGRWAMAQMTKIPYMASWLDGGERVGLSHDVLIQPMTDAADAEIQLWKSVGSKVMEAIEGRDKADIKRHNRKIFIPELKDATNDGNLMGHQVLAVALNTGNQGNLRKMLLGEGWANPENDAEITLQNPKLQAVLNNMTKSDWELVQLIWDQMEELYPQLAEVHRRTTGLVPPKVDATPVQTEFGTFKGGYYPMKYDSNRSHQAEMNEDKLNAQTDSMFSTIGSIQASVNASATNERTKYYAPIRLSLDVVPGHFQETIHYITHHDAVREVNKLIRNKSVAETIKAKLGPEEYAQLKPWLNDLAKDGKEAPTKMFWDGMLGRLRFGLTLGTMGFRVTTGLIQISGLSNTVAEVGAKPVLQAARNILGSTTNMREAWDFANSNSKVLNHRTQTMDREIKNAMNRIAGKRGMLAAVQEASMKHIAYIQTYMVDLPSWYASYMKKLDETGDEQKAYQYADWVVENVQGSGMTKDMARIMRGQSESGRMFTMFMTFFSSLWNMERDLVKGARSKRYSVTTTAAKLAFLFSIPVLFEMLMRGEVDDDEPEETMQKILTKTATFPVQSVPFIRDIVNGATGEFGYNISPIASLLDTGTRSIPALVAASLTDDEITKSQVKGATKVGGAALGIPGINQVWATGEHLYDVIEEGEDFTTREFLFGPKRD